MLSFSTQKDGLWSSWAKAGEATAVARNTAAAAIFWM
jgi:hypothetical protein